MILQQDIDAGVLAVLLGSLWCFWALLLFSALAITDAWTKSFSCALVLTLETSTENGFCLHFIDYTYEIQHSK
jgi:hypothetical protein